MKEEYKKLLADCPEVEAAGEIILNVARGELASPEWARAVLNELGTPGIAESHQALIHLWKERGDVDSISEGWRLLRDGLHDLRVFEDMQVDLPDAKPDLSGPSL